MVDLAPVLALLREGRTAGNVRPHAGANRGHPNALNSLAVPAVPVVPGERPLLLIRAAADVLERAAFLEFCGGHDRAAADRMAVREYGLESWEALALALAPAAPGEEP